MISHVVSLVPRLFSVTPRGTRGHFGIEIADSIDYESTDYLLRSAAMVIACLRGTRFAGNDYSLLRLTARKPFLTDVVI